MDGYTLFNKRDPPPHTMEGIVGKVLIGKNCHAQPPSNLPSSANSEDKRNI